MPLATLHLPSPRIFRNPLFARFWAGRWFATLAIQMQATAMGWQVYDSARAHGQTIAEAAFVLGLIGLAQFLPLLALSLLGGQVMMMFDNIPSALPHIKAGKLRALATTGTKRDPALPDLPTIAESGVAGYDSGVWFGLTVPAGTPKDVVAKLNDAGNKGIKSPDFIKRMTELGYNIMGGTPDQMADMLKVEVGRWGPIVKASGAKAD